MKQCAYCGQASEDGAKFCNNCGSPFPVNEAPAVQNPAAGPYGQNPAAGPYGQNPTADPFGQPAYYTPRVATKKEFLNLPENKKVKSELDGAAIICYICAGVTLLVGILAGGFPLILLDVAILAGLGLGIHLTQSRVCAVVLLVYAAVSMIMGLVQNGRPSGYLVVIAGVIAVIYTFKAEKLWQQHRQGV